MKLTEEPKHIDKFYVDIGNVYGEPQPLHQPIASHPKTVHRMYATYTDAANNQVICTISQEGRVVRDGIDITNNDEALAQCFVEYLAIKGIKVDRKEWKPQK